VSLIEWYAFHERGVNVGKERRLHENRGTEVAQAGNTLPASTSARALFDG